MDDTALCSLGMKTLFSGFIAGLLAATVSVASADEGYAALIVDSLMHYIPENAEGTPLGLHYDILKAIEAELGQPININMAPSPRVYESFAHNQIDMTILVNTERMHEADSIKVYLFTTHFYLYSRADSPILTLQEASGIVGRLRGGCLALNNRNVEFFELNSYEQGVEMLSRGRLQGLCGSDALFNAVETYSPSGKGFRQLLLGEIPVWLHLQPDMAPESIREVTRAAKVVAESGVVATMMQKYMQLPFVVLEDSD